MPRKDAPPPETPVQRAVREFYTAHWEGTGKSCGWDRDKHGKFRAEFARDAEAAWIAAQAENAEDSARLDWIEAKGYAVRSRSNGHRNCVAWFGCEANIRASIDRANAREAREKNA